MGLGAWLAAQTDTQRYNAEVERVKTKSTELAATHDEVLDIFRGYGASDATARALLEDMMIDRCLWVKVSVITFGTGSLMLTT